MEQVQPQNYQEWFTTVTQALEEHKTHPRLQKLWFTLRLILQAAMNQNGYNPSFQKELDGELKKLDYPTSSNEEGPFCSKRIQRYYRCYDCDSKGNRQANNSISCYCTDCFQIDRHPNHNFRLIETKLAVCDCGDPNALDVSSFCSKHKEKKKKQPIIDLNTQEEFIGQMRFILQLLFGMVQIKANFTDDSKKKEIFALAFLRKINDFAQKSYTNKIITTRFFASEQIFIPKSKCNDTSLEIMEILFRPYGTQSYIDKFSQMLLPLYTVKEMRQLVIGKFFTNIVDSALYLTDKSPLSKVMFQYLNSQSQVEEVLQKVGPLVIRHKSKLFLSHTTHGSYMMLFCIYLELLSRLKHAQITVLLLDGLNITKLTNYYQPKMEKSCKGEFFTLEHSYFEVACNIIKNLIQLGRKDLLQVIMRDCIQHIKQKDPSPSFSTERTFSLAFFAFIDYEMEHIFDMKEADILEIFQEEDEEGLINTLNSLIKKALVPLKVDNVTDLRRYVYNRPTAANPFLMLSADHLYLKGLLNILMRLQQPSSDSLLTPITNYIDSRKHTIEVLFNLFLSEEICKLQETIEIFFYQLSVTICHLIFLSETSLYQLIASSYLDPSRASKAATFEFLEFLVYIYEPPSVKEFRLKASKYIKNDKLIEEFARTAYSKYKGEVARGMVPGNHFNVSYASFYIEFKSFKESGSMYELKLKNYRRTELSRYIFSSEMLDELHDVYKNMFAMFCRQFRGNDAPNSRIIMSSAIEAAFLLSLETKDRRFDELAQNFISTGYFQSMQDEYPRHLIQMYKSVQKQLAEEKALVKLFTAAPMEEIDKKLREKAAFKLKKINQIKERQRIILQKAEIDPSSPRDRGTPQQISCTICKDQGKTERLNYLCHTRFSNFVKFTSKKAERLGGQKEQQQKQMPEVEQPMLVSTTCGHAVHFSCLKQSIQITDQFSQEFQFHCFLCKSYSNSVFPIMSGKVGNKCSLQGKEKENYLPKLASFVISLMEGIPYMEQQIDYEKFNLQEIMFSSISQCIYYYSIQFPKFFMIKQLPLLKEQLLLLYTSSATSQQFLTNYLARTMSAIKSQNNSQQNLWILWIKLKLISIALKQVKMNFEEDGLSMLNIKKGELQHTQLEQVIIALKELSSTHPFDCYALAAQFKLRDKQQLFLHLPNDLLQLNSQIGKCPTCKKATSKILLCFLCGFKTCEACDIHIKKHVKLHLDSCIFVRAQMGDCIFYFETDRLSIKSLYIDYAGDDIDNPANFPPKDTYMLSAEKRRELCEVVLDDMVRMEVLVRRHPNRCEVQ